jgi:hypothetical protein
MVGALRGKDFLVNTDRIQAETRFREENGSGQEDAALAARAMHPFDDGIEPGKNFAHEATQRARAFGQEVAGLRGNDVGVAAERAIEALLELARDHREMHYVALFEDVLEHAGGPVAAPESGE